MSESHCDACGQGFPSAASLITHKRMYAGGAPHKDAAKDSLVEWLEKYHRKGQRFAQRESFFEVKDWIEKTDPKDPEYSNISTTFMQYGIDMEILKDKTVFKRKDIRGLVTDHNSALDDLYTSKIWGKICILRQS